MLDFKEMFIDLLKGTITIFVFAIATCFFLNIFTLCLDMHRFVTYKESVGITTILMYVGYVLSIFNRMK